MSRFALALALFFTAFQSAAKKSEVFSLELPNDPERPRSTSWAPLLSLFLPSFDQFYEGQYGAGAVYLSIAGTGVMFVSSSIDENGNTPELDNGDLMGGTDRSRKYMYGNQLYLTAGSLSAYHSFRSAVRTRKPLGQYDFLPKEETVDELLLAPFRFDFLKRKTTYLPLGILALAAFSYDLALDKSERRSVRGKDFLFASGVSYNAGVGEEALFRGWMMPSMQQSFDSPFWSNSISSLLFAAAHISSDNPLPWPQFLVGYYLGWLTQKNDWTISESIFIHTWWDVIALIADRIDGQGRSSVYFQVPFTF